MSDNRVKTIQPQKKVKTIIRVSFILAAATFLFAAPTQAQNKKTTMQILTSTTWGEGREMTDFEGNTHWDFRRFDNKYYYGAFVREKNSYKATSVMPYYLSDTPDKEFDESKMGKAKDGKYMIVKMSDRLIFAYEFREITPERITWSVLNTTGGPISLSRSPVDPWKGKGTSKIKY